MITVKGAADINPALSQAYKCTLIKVMVLLLSSVDKEDNWNLLKFIGGDHVCTHEADHIKLEWNYSHYCHIMRNQTESKIAVFKNSQKTDSSHDNEVLPLSLLRSN